MKQNLKNLPKYKDEDWKTSPELLPCTIEQLDSYDREYEIATLLRLYDPTALPLYLRDSFSYWNAHTVYEYGKINIVQQIVRHALNYFGKSFPKPVFLPASTDIETRNQAEALTKFTSGLFYKNDLYKELRKALLFGCILGTGIIKVIPGENDITYESVMPHEVYVDAMDAQYGSPSTIFQRKYLSKSTLTARFPNLKDSINNAEAVKKGKLIDHVEVCEAWYSHPEEGRHILLISPDIVIVNEPWPYRHPFAIFRYFEQPAGFFGGGLASLLLPYQLKINELLRNIEANIRLGGNLKLLVSSQSQIDPKTISNDLRGNLVQYNGTTPPQYLVQPLISPDLLNHLDYTIQQAWRAARFSPDMAGGQLPTGITSKVAILAAADVVSEQHILTGKCWESFVLDIADMTIDAARSIRDAGGNIETIFPTGDSIEVISLRDVLMEPDEYRIEIQPTSRVRDTIAGRLEFAQYMSESGLWSPDDILEVLDLPDTNKTMQLRTAARKAIEKQISDVMSGKPVAPSPKMNLQLAAKTALEYYSLYLSKGIHESDLKLLSDYIDAIDNLMKLAQQQIAAASAPAAPEGEMAPETIPAPEPTGV